MISFSEIFKQAFAILRAHKFLWALGLFLFWDLAANVISYVVNQNPNLPAISVGPVTAIVGVLLILLFIQLAFRARAALIWATKNLLEKKQADFSRSFFEARKYYFRIFKIWLGTIFVMIVAGIILITPIAYLISINYAERASVLGILALLIFIPISIVANFINNLAPMFVIFYDMNFRNAINASMDLVRKYWFVFLWFAVSLGILTFLAGYLLVIVGGAGVVFFVQIFYNTAGIHITTASILLGICAFAAFLIFAGALASFQQICWTLLFMKFSRPVKTEAEIVPVPEAIN